MAGPPPPIEVSPKTPAKSPALVPQAHGGAIHHGGVPGNKGGTGRPPNELKAGWLAAISTPEVAEARRTILANPEHPQWTALYTKLCILAGGLPGKQEDATDDAIPHVHLDL